jgi:ubiquinol-cytochrome c reductase cytochrome b subunit
LKDFGSYAWVRGLLENPRSTSYFGKVPQCDGMAEWKKSSKLKAKELDEVARFVASFVAIPADMSPEEWAGSPGVADHPGLKPFVAECGKCHIMGALDMQGGLRDAPSLFAWGSPQWIARMIHKPGAPDLYGYFEKKDDQMPPFSEEQLTTNDVDMLVRYLKNDYLGAPSAQTASATSKR